MSNCPECGWDSYPPVPYTVQDGELIIIKLCWDDKVAPWIDEEELEKIGEQNIYPKIYDGKLLTITHKCPICNKEFSFRIIEE